MSDDDESRRFARIVAQLRQEDPRFATDRQRRRARVLLLAGIALCLTAVLLIAFGGPKGAVVAVLPWLAGLITVIRSRR